MCLDTLSKMKTRRKTGYKLLYRQVGNKGRAELTTGYCNGKRQTLRVGEWVTDKPACSMIGSCSNAYPSGFHIFLSKRDAEYFRSQMGWSYAVLRKVRFKNVVAVGSQIGGDVVVARTIMLMKE